ncbi:MAG: Ig-like domain-containing protein [Alistipes sp.]|nr:Ig-like domain-containing protein [Alistipes sp.]
MNRRINILLRTAVAMLFLGAFFSRCANIMTPTGGPKDTLAPVIVTLNPDNFTTNFNAKKIYIEFNEYVQLKDQQKELFTSPAMKKMPLLSIRGKGIVITIRDTLRENTTYAIDLGSAVRDNNEGNPINAMRYVFSTGDKVDSLVCSGYTADSYKADSVSRTFIWFFAADSLPDTPDYDSTIFNRKPDVIARAQNNGIFIAQNLKPIDYRIYAFGDKNDNQLYEPGTDLVGLLDSTYNPAKMPDFAIWFDSLRMYPSAEPQLYFRMFTDEAFKAQRLVEAQRPQQKELKLFFNTAHPRIEELKLDSIPSNKILYDPRTVGKDTVSLWLNVPAENLPDTIKGEITYFRHDSIRQLTKTTEPIKVFWKYIESKDEQKAREKEEKERKKAEEEGREYTPPTKPNPFKMTTTAQGDVNPEKGVDFTLTYPAIAMDTTAIKLYQVNGEGQAATETEVKHHFERDTLNMSHWYIRAKLKEATSYRLFFPKDAIEDVMGYKNDSTSNSFKTYDPEKFGRLVIRVRGVGDKRYIIQQTDSSSKTQQELTGVKSGKYTLNYIPASEIRIRIIEDTNNNGKWDAGNVVKRLQPERAEMYMNDMGEDLFAIKANWDVELDIDMSKVFVPMTMQNLVKMLDDKEAARIKKLFEEWQEKALKMQKEGGHDHNHNSNSSSSGGMIGGMGGMGGGLGGITGGIGGFSTGQLQ